MLAVGQASAAKPFSTETTGLADPAPVAYSFSAFFNASRLFFIMPM